MLCRESGESKTQKNLKTFAVQRKWGVKKPHKNRKHKKSEHIFAEKAGSKKTHKDSQHIRCAGKAGSKEKHK